MAKAQITIKELNERYTLAIAKPRIKYSNVYVAEVSFMSGDADVYEQEEWTFATDAELIKFLDAVPGFYELSNRREWSIKDAPREVQVYFDMLSEEEFNLAKSDADNDDWMITSADTYADYVEDFYIDWPRDKSCEDCGDASFDGYTLYWYDKNGKQSQVGVTKKGGKS